MDLGETRDKMETRRPPPPNAESSTGLAQVVGVLDESASDLAAASESADAVLMNVRMVSAMAGQIAQGLDHAAGETRRAGSITATALQSVDEMARRMDVLEKLVEEIDTVVRDIGSLAQHTTLLALNAAIEAAHAGDAGLGFAVVAAEVKALAGQTAHATTSVSARLSAISQAVREAGLAESEVRSSVGKMSSISAAVAGSVQEQAEMARSITGFIGEAATSVEALSGTANRVSTRVAAARDEVGERAALEFFADDDGEPQADDADDDEHTDADDPSIPRAPREARATT